MSKPEFSVGNCLEACRTPATEPVLPLEPLTALRLALGETAVFCVSLRQPPETLRQLREHLTENERLKAGRFHRPADQDRSEIGRAVLRMALASLLGLVPNEVPIVAEPNHKPRLAAGTSLPDIRFNLSHSGEVILFALTEGADVGADVEQVSPEIEALSVSQNFFSDLEHAGLLEIPPSDRIPAFYRCWTRKEAYVKAIGAGLSHPLDAFDVTISWDEPPRLIGIRDSLGGDPADWSFASFEPAPGHLAAVAARRCGGTFVLHDMKLNGGTLPEAEIVRLPYSS